MNQNEILELIFERMRDYGMTMTELGRLSGIHKNSLYLMKSTGRTSVETLLNMLKVLDLKLEIVKLEDIKQNKTEPTKKSEPWFKF